MTGQTGISKEERHIINRDKAIKLAALGIYYSEFGARRRKSYENQDMVVANLKKFGEGHMLGTSNVYLAMKHDLMPAGTVAHEWYQAHGAVYGYKMANKMANEAWVTVYEGNLGTALPDTFTTDVFLKTFNTKFAKLYDGLRQDSGKPLVFLKKVLKHYEQLRINPMYKYVMFSDNLNSIEKLREIHEACVGKIPDRYGLGTWLSNDVGVKPLNMVIKLTGFNYDGTWVNTVKLSDDPMKHNGDEKEVELCKKVLGI